MKFKLTKVQLLSGQHCKIYSIHIDGDDNTLFEQFLEENRPDFPNEVKSIVKDLIAIGRFHGAKDYFFRPKKEGKLGDGVEALFDVPNALLRLYAIKYSNVVLILGNGGHKPKHIRAFQEDPKLTKENFLVRQIASILYKAIKEKDLRWNQQGDDFAGQLDFDSEDY